MGALLGKTPSIPSTSDNKIADVPSNSSPPCLSVSTSLMDLPCTPHSASGFAGWYGTQRETPSSAARYLSPPEMRFNANGESEGYYFWFAQSPSKERR